jgi:hypothetical protein
LRARPTVYDMKGLFGTTENKASGRVMASRRCIALGFVLSVAVAGALAPAASASTSTGYFVGLSAAPANLQRGGTAAPLPDGQVLIAGGVDDTPTVLNSASLYNRS